MRRVLVALCAAAALLVPDAAAACDGSADCDASADAAAPVQPPGENDAGGCACQRNHSATPDAWSAVLALPALAAARRRARRPRQ